MANETIYNEQQYYKEVIEPKLDEIVTLCRRKHIPVFFTAAIKNNGSSTEYDTKLYSTIPNEIRLKDDKLIGLANVMAGFKTVPYENSLDFYEDDFSAE